MSWRGVIILCLFIGALLSGWAVWKHRNPPVQIAAASARPDYVLHDFELTALNGEGKESFTLRAPNLERRPNDDSMSLTTPVFQVPDGNGKYWDIRSKQGWVSADQKEIRLIGDVKANSPADDLRPITMNTERLNVFPGQNRASTDAVMTIVQPGSILRGRGFAVSTTTKRYVFRSEVKSRYVTVRR
ncbi:MAG: LPS export ABC transporter periplasmic protein LptC [Xanthomonadales bacterium]|nr:LPS export ABC transporter periplasmic protein LptC [Xanthomonadales bacterium]